MAYNFSSTQLGHTLLFPCSTGVHTSDIGAGNSSKVKVALGNSKMSSKFPMTLIREDVQPVNKRYMDMISTGLTFSEEVIEDRCLHMMPYSEKYFANIFNPGDLISNSKRANSVYRKKLSYAQHIPLKIISKPHHLAPVETQFKDRILHYKHSLLTSAETVGPQSTDDLITSDSKPIFLTELNNKDVCVSDPKQVSISEMKSEAQHSQPRNNTQFESEVPAYGAQKCPTVTVEVKGVTKANHSYVSGDNKHIESQPKAYKNDWDDHLLSKLSQLTANWIVYECMPADKQKEKLSSVLKSWYGQPTHTELVREEISDGDEEDKKKDQKPKKKWKKKEAFVLARVYNMIPPPAKAVDPYSDDNKATFYRQPAGNRKKIRCHDKEEGAVNKTAHNISIREIVEAPPPKLKDILNPHAGDKIYDTDNLYQQEWLSGKHHVYNVNGNSDEILMDTENKYRKQLQQEMPLKPDMWYSTEEGVRNKEKFFPRKPHVHKPKKGQKRWISLPQLINEAEHLMTITSTDSVVTKTTDPNQRQKIRQNSALISVVLDWHKKWFLCGQYADSTPDDLIRDMADIQPHVRLKAVGTVAKVAEYKTDSNNNVYSFSGHDCVADLPEKIFVALECLLDDSHAQVRKAAAITLYTLERPNEKAKKRLMEMLVSESEVDRWTSAHCLATYDECDSNVVAEVIKQILSTESTIKYEQGIHLLAEISNHGNLVHFMVAELLNSHSWRHRVIACTILPTLFGIINKDITHKLSDLMWHDWNVEVRNAASQCLGKTNHGRNVHDAIKEKLLHGTEKTKLEAISKLGQLGIMTAKLLPAFLLCFADLYVSIRCEVCITCGNLQIKEEQVIKRLLHLATLDPSWRVKALAIQALGKIGEVTDEIKECLLWAMKYEDKPGVRAEACHSLVVLNIRDDDVIDTLQERLLVESSQIVREEMTEALSMFGLNATEDSDMVAQIKSEVRKLCHRNIIASQIIVNEMDDVKKEQLKSMVYLTEADIKALNEKKAVMLEKVQTQTNSTDSLTSSSRPKLSTSSSRVKVASYSTTPEPMSSREWTDLTPATDKELQELLSHDKSESWSVSSKSRPSTRKSAYPDTEKDLRGLSHMNEEGDTIDYNSGKEAGCKDYEIENKKIENLQNYLSLPTGSFQNGLPSLPTSANEQKGSRLSFTKFDDRRSIVSKGTKKERKKFNQKVSAAYLNLDARYADLNKHLIIIDKGFNTRELSTDSEANDSGVLKPIDEIHVVHAGELKGINDEISTKTTHFVVLESETQDTCKGLSD